MSKRGADSMDLNDDAPASSNEPRLPKVDAQNFTCTQCDASYTGSHPWKRWYDAQGDEHFSCGPCQIAFWGEIRGKASQHTYTWHVPQAEEDDDQDI